MFACIGILSMGQMYLVRTYFFVFSFKISLIFTAIQNKFVWVCVEDFLKQGYPQQLYSNKINRLIHGTFKAVIKYFKCIK